MERFHKITLLVASVSLIVILLIASMLILKDKRSQKFPTSQSSYPDGWTLNATTRKITFDSGANGPNSGRRTYTVSDNICVNKQWADREGVYWDGVTTYNGC
jgi:hypothetical protein